MRLLNEIWYCSFEAVKGVKLGLVCDAFLCRNNYLLFFSKMTLVWISCNAFRGYEDLYLCFQPLLKGILGFYITDCAMTKFIVRWYLSLRDEQGIRSNCFMQGILIVMTRSKILGQHCNVNSEFFLAVDLRTLVLRPFFGSINRMNKIEIETW